MSQAIAVPKRQHFSGGLGRALNIRQMGGGRAAMEAIMRARGEPLPASTKRVVAEHYAKTQPRFRIGTGDGLYLAPDGQGVTDRVRSSWFGNADQAECALQRFAHAKGMKAIPIVKVIEPSFRDSISPSWGQ